MKRKIIRISLFIFCSIVVMPMSLRLAFSGDYEWVIPGDIMDVKYAEMSANGKYFAVGGRFNGIHIIELKSGHLKYAFKGEAFKNILSYKNIFKFSDKGNYICVQKSNDNDYEIWGLEGELSLEKKGFLYSVKEIFYFEDEYVITLSTGNCFYFWDKSNYQFLFKRDPQVDIDGFLYNCRNQTIIGKTSENLIVYSIVDFKSILTIPLKYKDKEVRKFYLSPDGKLIYIIFSDENDDNSYIVFYNAISGNEVNEFKDGYKEIENICIAEDSKSFYYIKGDYLNNSLMSRNIYNGKREIKKSIKLPMISHVYKINDGIFIYSLFLNRGSLLDSNNYKETNRYFEFEERIHNINFSYDDRYLGVWEGIKRDESRLKIIEVERGKAIKRYDVHNDAYYWFEFSPNEEELIFADKDNYDIILLEYLTGDTARVLDGHKDIVTSGKYYKSKSKSIENKLLSFSLVGTLITSSLDGSIKIWNPKSGDIKYNYQHSKGVIYASYTNDPTKVFFMEKTENDSTALYILDIKQNEIIYKKVMLCDYGSIYPNPAETYDNELIAFILYKMIIFKKADLRLYDEFKYDLDIGFWSNAEFSTKDNNIIAYGVYDTSCVVVKNIRSDSVLCILKDYPFIKTVNQQSMSHLRFSHDGKYLATSNNQRSLILWKIQDITGIEENGKTSFDNELSIYPNPSSDIINIRTKEAGGGFAELIIFNSIGEKIKSERIDYFGNEFRFDVSDFDTGLYFVRIKYKDKEYYDKFIKY